MTTIHATVGDVLLGIETGKSVKTKERPALPGELGILKVSAVTWGTFRPEENKAVFDEHDPGDCPRPAAGDLLISRANTRELVGAPVLVERDYPDLLLSDKTLRLVPDEARVERRYLVRALRSAVSRRHFESRAGGTSGSMTNITQQDIRSAPVLLPALTEQRRIADVLDRADAIRRKRKEAMALTEELLRSVFLEMFGDPVTNPKGWHNAALGEVATQIDYGVTASAASEAVGPKFLRITDIQDNRVRWAGVPHCLCDSSTAERARLEPGDIVFARTGATTGKSFWIRDCPTDAVFASYLIRVRPGSQLAPSFLASFFQSEGYWRQIRTMAEGAAQPGVNASKLAAVVVPVPPRTQQAEHERVVSRVLAMQVRLEAALADAESLFESLVDRAFSGASQEGASC